ncbi:hypothetical protein [Adlercreutzia sp. ZJ242]|uniref:hypothetical protein n=1 Tax=Adlercreutzia sp. ZJ242 TaxID=2709409 RepID=UPI0013EADA70|nr:hypothetical protein [Adlercreutzia sp. ZJ242]
MVGTKLAPPAGSGAKLTTRLLAALMALVLCAGLMPAIPAWAAEDPAAPAASEQTADTATLTIVKGVPLWGDVAPVVNASFDFEKNATIDDLFKAAQQAGLIKGYEFGNTFDGENYYLSSVTTADGTAIAGSDGYWMSGVDGDNATAVSRDIALEAGKAYQLAWCANVSDIQPTKEQWTALAANAKEVGAAAQNASTVTLSLVKGVGYDSNGKMAALPVVNGKFSLAKDAKVDDLFKAAQQAGLIKGYEFGSTSDGENYYLSSVTTADGTVIAGSDGFWMSGVDGDNATAVSRDMALEVGKAYQLAWCANVSDIQPTKDQWVALAKVAKKAQGSAQGEEAVTPSPSTAKVDASALDADLEGVHRTLFVSLTAGCAGAGGPSESNVSDWNALSIAAAGQASTANKDAVIAEAQASYDKPDGYNLQRSILVLTALGVDATKVPAATGTIDLVAKLADTASAVDSYPTSAAFTLMAYAAGPYEVPASAVNSAQALLDKLALSQEAGGGFASSWGVDTTAMVVPALAAYQGNPLASDMLSHALGSMRSLQQDDGGFGNVNSTAVAVIALCAAGVDPAGEAWATTTGSTPLKALLASANEDLTGFVIPQGYSQKLADQQGFMALVAYQGLKNTGAAYNVYTQAAKGEAALPSVPNPQDPAAGQTTQGSQAPSGSALAQTGDDAGASAGVVAAALLGALACAVTARRRASRAAQDAVVR